MATIRFCSSQAFQGYYSTLHWDAGFTPKNLMWKPDSSLTAGIPMPQSLLLLLHSLCYEGSLVFILYILR